MPRVKYPHLGPPLSSRIFNFLLLLDFDLLRHIHSKSPNGWSEIKEILIRMSFSLEAFKG